MREDFVITIQHKSDVLIAQEEAKNLARNFNFKEKSAYEISIIAGELASNIFKYGRKPGEIKILYHPESAYIEIIAQNHDTGIPEEAFQDGYSTSNSLGIGLGAVKRLSDELIYEGTETTQIRAIKWRDTPISRTDVAVLSYPLMGSEAENGDGYIVRHNHTEMVGVVDALGHGEEAHRSTVEVKEFIEGNHSFSVDKLITGIHEQLKGKRGVSLSLMKINYKANQIEFSGVGDVTTRIYVPSEDKPICPLTHDGIVGENLRNVKINRFELIPNSIIVMFSDGVSHALNVPVSMHNLCAMDLVHELMQKYGKSTDDRTLLVAVLGTL